jgi:hypothetical protein
MRPVTRGRARQRVYQDFKDALPHLEQALGKYCSYCERFFPAGLAVEHVIPKTQNKRLRNVWRNFLLSCSNCNSVKQDKRIRIGNYLWPDRDNTFRAFRYDNGLADVALGLPPKAHLRAKRLMKLVGLHRHLGQTQRRDKPAKRDERASQRERVWKLASSERTKLAGRVDNGLRDTIVELAKVYGFYSVWMAVFGNDQDMRCRLISAFKNTSGFNAVGQPVPRGRL